ALGGELEATFDLRVETREVEAGAEDVSVLSLPGRRLGAEVALVPGGLLRPRRTGVAADLDLVAVEDEGGRRVVGGDLRVQLAVVGLEVGLVADVGDRQQLDLLLAVGAPDPQAVLDDRATELGAVVVDADDLVALLEVVGRLRAEHAELELHELGADGARARAERARRGRRAVGGRQVAVAEARVRLVAVGGLVVPAAATPLVGAALGDHIENDAAGSNGGIRAASGDLHLLEGVEVVVGRG